MIQILKRKGDRENEGGDIKVFKKFLIAILEIQRENIIERQRERKEDYFGKCMIVKIDTYINNQIDEK